ncbi:type II toxin-antitoxin system RelE/ParE family toxin [Micromonospora carbonacea]|uniref:type II toxin-antitoxin system RelE/ParE family toxin n=1 Tax=Micromonospora carbonacea TaxID=47853 RepID=UPI001C671C37|nr:type II toxin-antitoxin system RelE/ParE family toxin [Micromonospora carbonacea]
MGCDWLEGLSTALFARAAFYVDLLGGRGPLLGEPYTKQLDGKLRESRFYLDRDPVRVSYWIATDRRIILLTALRKTRMREDREVERARRALERCVAERHTVHQGAER